MYKRQYEGAEKRFEYSLPQSPKAENPKREKLTEEEVLSREKGKIKSAILTDFILSVEIVIIALSSVENQDLVTKILVVTIIALIATVGVYGIVALIVRMDDYGLKLIELNDRENSFSDKIGHFLVNALPKVIKSLTVIGTIALLLVSGGIFVHNIDFFHGLFESLPGIIVACLTGIVARIVVLLIINYGCKVW